MAVRQSFKQEYVIKASPAIVFHLICTPSGLSQWFADSVDNDGECFTFNWEGSEEKAKLIGLVENESIRFHWDKTDQDEFFEIRLSKRELTGETVILFSDFADEQDVPNQRMIWDSQVKSLLERVGG